MNRPTSLAVLYEHPTWFERLFAALDRRGVPYAPWLATEHILDPAAVPGDVLVFNRMSASAATRDHAPEIPYVADLLAALELRGVPVINGARAYGFEISKARQMTLIESLGLKTPRSRVIHRPEQAVAAARELHFPIVVKPNTGGRGSGVVRFDDLAVLEATVRGGALDLGPGSIALVQEFLPKRDGKITRVEVLDGRYLYAIDVTTSGETFDLCPADICRVPVAQGEVCLTDPAPTVSAVKANPPQAAIDDVIAILDAAGVQIGGVEFLVDDRTGERFYYDINALSNFVANPVETVGFDPWDTLADWLEAQLRGVAVTA